MTDELAPPDWFATDAQGKFEKHLAPLARYVDSYLEVGVCCGDSMAWMVNNMRPLTAVGVDWWRDPRGDLRRQRIFDSYKKHAHERLDPFIQSKRVELVCRSSKEYMATTERKFDLIYCDGDHSGAGAMRDWLLAYELLSPARVSKRTMVLDSRKRRVGGILVIDDLQRLANRGKLEVRPAWDMFIMLMHGRMRRLWEDGRQAAAIRID